MPDSTPSPASVASSSRAEHFAVEADPLDLAHEFGAVGGVAHGGGRDDLRLLDLHVVEQQPEALSAASALSRASFGKAAGPLEPGAEAGQHLFVEDRRRDPRRPGIDDEPDRVRPDVDDRRRARPVASAHRPRWKRSLGTLRPFFSAWPRPDSAGLDMK